MEYTILSQINSINSTKIVGEVSDDAFIRSKYILCCVSRNCTQSSFELKRRSVTFRNTCYIINLGTNINDVTVSDEVDILNFGSIVKRVVRIDSGDIAVISRLIITVREVNNEFSLRWFFTILTVQNTIVIELTCLTVGEGILERYILTWSIKCSYDCSDSRLFKYDYLTFLKLISFLVRYVILLSDTLVPTMAREFVVSPLIVSPITRSEVLPVGPERLDRTIVGDVGSALVVAGSVATSNTP